MKISILLSLFVTLSVCAQIDNKEKDGTAAGEVICPEKAGTSLGYCLYTVQNLNRAQALIAKVNQALFNGRPPTSDVGILQPFGENEQQVLFRHKDPNILEKLKTIIPLLDTLENFSTYSIVEIRTDIYEISESGLSSLGAEITNLKFGSLFENTNDDGYGVTGNQSGLGVDLKFGTFELQALLSAEKSKGTLNRKGTIVRTVPNLSNLTYTDTTPIYFAPGAGTNVLQPETGVKLSGKVSINQYDNSLVNIKDFSLYYGTLTDGGYVNSVNIPFDNLILEEGVSFPIVSSKSIGTMKFKKRSIFGFGNSEKIEDSKLLVYTSSKVYNWDEYIESIQSLVKVRKTNFNSEDIESLPSDCLSDEEVLDDIILSANRDRLGDPVLSIKLNPVNACKANFNKRIKVRIRGEGIDRTENTTITTIERLMHVPIRIKGIMPRKFTESSLDFKLKIETLRGDTVRVKNKLEFAPSLYDIEDMFWIK